MSTSAHRCPTMPVTMPVTMHAASPAARMAARMAARLSAAVTARLGGAERGDVPGWVLITLMTAGLVTLLWGVAGSELENLFTNAIRSVTGPNGG